MKKKNIMSETKEINIHVDPEPEVVKVPLRTPLQHIDDMNNELSSVILRQQATNFQEKKCRLQMHIMKLDSDIRAAKLEFDNRTNKYT